MHPGSLDNLGPLDNPLISPPQHFRLKISTYPRHVNFETAELYSCRPGRNSTMGAMGTIGAMGAIGAMRAMGAIGTFGAI